MTEDRLAMLEELGYSETEARFLKLVALHSGLFLRRHYLVFAGLESGCVASLFLEKLIERGHVRLYILGKNARVYHLFSRQIYDALGLSNVRHRRHHGADYVRAKLFTMDYVLANPTLRYLPTEEEKVEFFTTRLEIPLSDLPAKAYKTPHSKYSTTRYFVEKFPITTGQIGDDNLVSFHYVDPGPYLGIADFINFLAQYKNLMGHFNPLRLVYIYQKTGKLTEAQRLFASMETPSEDKSRELARYFPLRKKWDAREFGALSQDDLKFFAIAKKRFSGPSFDEQYAAWKECTSLTSGVAKESLIEREFIPYQVGGNYDFFGEFG